MPDLDGVELLRHLRRRRLNVDVLLMSSDDDPALPRRILAEGAAAFLSKNEAPGLLLRSLTQTLSSVFAEMARRPAAHSPWDRFLPMLLRPNRGCPCCCSPPRPSGTEHFSPEPQPFDMRSMPYRVRPGRILASQTMGCHRGTNPRFVAIMTTRGGIARRVR